MAVTYGKVVGSLANGQLALGHMKRLVDLMVRQAQEAGVNLDQASFILGPSHHHPSGTMLTPIGWRGTRTDQVVVDHEVVTADDGRP